MTETETKRSANFIRHIVAEDLANNKNNGKVATRFPPEPNGYLHIGHAKSICLNFGIAEEYQGTCNLRFDDTNPSKEEQEYIDAIKEDVRWLGFDWGEKEYYASDYFDKFYDLAIKLIKQGKAYVCELNADQVREYRGTLTEAGKNSPYRDRSTEENLSLFSAMKNGQLEEGSAVLRAKIDMASPNMNMRDPTIYRIRKINHHQTGDKWCIYPMYDFAHCVSDALEGITHSLCTLEFADHRPLYDWYLDQLEVGHPQQIEFSRLSLQHTVVSKRKLKLLVDNGHVDGWSDPRMPTLSGLRRRGFTPASIREFCERIGVTKVDNSIEMAMLESCIRDDLGDSALRVMGVLRPLKLVIENFEPNKTEALCAPNHPQNETMGTRSLPFTREIYIDQADFREEANRKYKRLILGGEVRLRYGYVIKCNEAIKDELGNIVELRCTYDPETLGKNPEGRKVRGVIHWVSASENIPAEVRLYSSLFSDATPEAANNFEDTISADSLAILKDCRLESSLANADMGQGYQFEREGYFCLDSKHSSPDKKVFNLTVPLKDSWSKVAPS
jgi:glutaminyl-tRNA synthetase